MKYDEGDLVADRYEITALVGVDHNWENYKVFDQSTNLIFTLKVGSQNAHRDWPFRTKQKAAQALMALTHENIAAVYASGYTESGAIYLVLDSALEVSLKDLLDKQLCFSLEDSVSVFIQVAQALAYAHQNGQIHGHLTPANIWINESPQGTYLAKVTNFGTAELGRSVNTKQRFKATQSKELAEHALYVSPEQCNTGLLSVEADIYSLGCIMFEVLAGYPPFQSKNPIKVIWKHMTQKAPSLPVSGTLGVALQDLIQRCMHKVPALRYPSVTNLLSELECIRDGKPIKHDSLRLSKIWSFELTDLFKRAERTWQGLD